MDKLCLKFYREDKTGFAYTFNWHTNFPLAKILQNNEKPVMLLINEKVNSKNMCM